MKIKYRKRLLLSLTFIFFSRGYMIAQSVKNVVEQDPKFEQVLNEKRKINTSINVNDSFKIQIFSGSSENAKKTIAAFRQDFVNMDATIVFNTPNYKVWVGNFKTRIEAERALLEIRPNYKNVLLIKPSK